MVGFSKMTGYEKCAKLYDLFDTKNNIGFFRSYAQKHKHIIDIGAGTGRIAIPLAQKGIKLYCIEPSPAMRKVFREKIKNRSAIKSLIKIVSGNAMDFRLKQKFPMAFLSGVFDHFIGDQERLAALRNINFHLTDNGKLVFDIFLGSHRDGPIVEAGTCRRGNMEYRRFIQNKALARGKMKVLLTYEVYEKGILKKRIKERSLVGLTNRKHVHSMFKKTGFVTTNEFGDFARHSFTKKSSILIIEAEKIAEAQ